MYKTIADKKTREDVLADLALLYNLRNKTGSHFLFMLNETESSW